MDPLREALENLTAALERERDYSCPWTGECRGPCTHHEASLAIPGLVRESRAALAAQPPRGDGEPWRWAVWNPQSDQVHQVFNTREQAEYGQAAIGDDNPYVVVPVYLYAAPSAPRALKTSEAK